MAVYLSPGVFTKEVDLSALPEGNGGVIPAFVGACSKGPVGVPTLVTSAAQAIDVFGEPVSYLMQSVLSFFEQGTSCYIQRVAVEYTDVLPDAVKEIAVDSTTKTHGWGRIPLFQGPDVARLPFKLIDSSNPVTFAAASVSAPEFYQYHTATYGPTSASMTVSGTYTYTAQRTFSVKIVGAPNNPTAGARVGGAIYEVYDGAQSAPVLTGTFATTDHGTGPSVAVALNYTTASGEAVVTGLSFIVTVTSGELHEDDLFVFTATPDNRKFYIAVEHSTGSLITVPAGTYTSAVTLASTINALLGSEDYICTTSDTTPAVAVFQSVTSGALLQLVDSIAFGNTVGIPNFTLDQVRGHFLATNPGPYVIGSGNNSVRLDVISDTVKSFNFTLPSGTYTAAALASQLNNYATIDGVAYFSAISVELPGSDVNGDTYVLISTTTDNNTSTLKLYADYTYLSTLQFAAELGINSPFVRSYRGFNDSRTVLPTPSLLDPSIPNSCVTDPTGDQCAKDTNYYAEIVGFLIAPSAGTWSSDYKINLVSNSTSPGSPVGRYSLQISQSNGQVVESYDEIYFNPALDRYIGNVVNPGSKYGGVNGSAYVNWEIRPSTVGPGEVRLPSPRYNAFFKGGQNGIPTGAYSNYLDAAIVGNPSLASGLYAFQNPESIDISVLAVPGITSGAVIGTAIAVCESRGDVLMLVDPPFGLRPQQVVDWSNGVLPDGSTENALNTSYGALYWSWIKRFNQFSAEYEWVPPSGYVAAVIARTARDYEPWYAPAGLTRGRLTSALAVEYSPTEGERDLLYGNGNVVNPIVDFPQDGIIVFGQRTLQRAPTALDRVSVRLLMTYLKKLLTRSLRQFIFEPNDTILRAQVTNVLDPLLGDVLNRRGVTAYKIVCNDTNNTAERIDRQELWVSIFVKPTKAVEFIALNLVVLRTGASFTAEEILAAGGVVATN